MLKSEVRVFIDLRVEHSIFALEYPDIFKTFLLTLIIASLVLTHARTRDQDIDVIAI